MFDLGFVLLIGEEAMFISRMCRSNNVLAFRAFSIIKLFRNYFYILPTHHTHTAVFLFVCCIIFLRLFAFYFS